MQPPWQQHQRQQQQWQQQLRQQQEWRQRQMMGAEWMRRRGRLPPTRPGSCWAGLGRLILTLFIIAVVVLVVYLILRAMHVI